VRQLDLDGLDTEGPEGRGELAQAFSIGAVAATHRQRVVVEPQQIAALGHCLALEGGEDRDPELLEGLPDRGLLAPPELLAHAKDDRTLVGDDDGIVGEDGVGVVGQRRLVEEHLATGVAEGGNEGVVLSLGRVELWLRDVVPDRGVGVSEGIAGSTNEDSFQIFDHALGTERLHF